MSAGDRVEFGETSAGDLGGGASVFLVKGSEPSLVDRAVDHLLDELTSGEGSGHADGVAIEEHRAPGTDEELSIGPVIDALATAPFLAERRIVVLREAERLNASQAEVLATRLGESFSPNVLILTAVGKALPAALTRAVRRIGREIETSPGPSGKARTQWLGDQLHSAPVHLDAAARHMLEQHLGEDVSRLHPMLEVLSAAYGEGGRIGPAELAPFLGDEGGAPPWDLTDALDRGEVAAAVQVAHRMLGAGGRHPFQLLATLHRHYGAMLRLDGSGVTDPAGASSLLGMAAYPARKVLDQGRKLGPERIARAVSLIAQADLDLRGVIDWPSELVIEVLVARLAQLARTRTSAPAGGHGRASAK